MSLAGKLNFAKIVVGLFKNVVRGFSLVLHDPEGSHYRTWN